jgi:hypothetical protein
MIAKPEVHLISVCDLQPSQLYISQEKLSKVQHGFDPKNPHRIEPIPYKDLEGLMVMTDGHTRAFAAYLAESAAVPAYVDPDDLDWEAYQICVAWCHAEGIYSIADLAGRVVSAEDYGRLWYDRCREMQNELAEKR